MRVFGIDPGSERTGYGCVETDGSRHRIVVCGAISSPALGVVSRQAPRDSQPAGGAPRRVPAGLRRDREPVLRDQRRAARSSSGTRAASRCWPRSKRACRSFEYTPAEIKRAVVGYGRAEKQQVQQMVKLLLGLAAVPSPHDAADALAVAICHVHAQPPARAVERGAAARSQATSWRPTSPPPRRCAGAASPHGS